MRRFRIDGYVVSAWLLAACYAAVLWFTAPAIGFARDEGYYFKAARLYVSWVDEWSQEDALSDKVILKHFDYNHEHPPLVKLTQGMLHKILHEGLGVASSSQGFRAAGFLFGGLMLIATFYLGRYAFGSREGLLASGLLASMPRPFFDAHLACFDIPMTAMWTWSLFTFIRAWGRARLDRAAWTAGIVLGLSLSTKLNALFLPFVFVLVWLADPPTQLRPWRRRGPRGGMEWVLPPVPRLLVRMAWVSALVFFASWPYLWHDPLGRVLTYLKFHLEHEHYPISYFHQLLVAPPFPPSFPWVMTFFTVPSPILILSGVGAGMAIAAIRRRPAVSVLLLSGALLPIVLISLPNTPIFGGTKHWYTALPCLSILAAQVATRGLTTLSAAVAHPALRLSVSVAGVMLFCGPGVLGAMRTHPHGIAYYNELAGGVRGGAELGMQRAFWSTVAGPLYDEIPANARVFFNRTNHDSFLMLQEEGRLRPRVRYRSNVGGSSAALHFEQPEHGEMEAAIWQELGTRPTSGVYLDAVTLGQLYIRGRSNRPPDAEEP
ncbi:MAG: ArnT family glycosyltransferase [Myxococcota bacterium]